MIGMERLSPQMISVQESYGPCREEGSVVRGSVLLTLCRDELETLFTPATCTPSCRHGIELHHTLYEPFASVLCRRLSVLMNNQDR